MLEIFEAIKTKSIITFRYNDEIINRKAEVYVIGLGGTGELLIRAFQIGEGWKLFKVFNMVNVSNTSMRFHKRADYNPNDKAFKKITKQIK